MANAKKCDICGKFYVPPLGSALMINNYTLIHNNPFSLSNSIYDLCSSCNEKLNNFVKSMREEECKGEGDR